jgi:Kef-type K+ transport system membrane component KefB
VLLDGLLALAGVVLVVAVGYGGAQLATRMRQPRIAGQFVAVVLVGPTVLGGRIDGVVSGQSASGAVGALFPATSVALLGFLGALGLMLYMLLVGLTIDPRPLVRRAGTVALLTLAVTAATVVVALPAAARLRDAGGWSGAGADATAFALVLTAALVANGVPVVARVLEELALLRTDVGAIAIAAAGVITTLGLIVSGVAIRGGDASAAERFAVILAAAAVLFAVVVPLARAQRDRVGPGAAVVVLLGFALAAGVAGRGLLGTALVGPLLVGILANGAGSSAAAIERRLGWIVREALLPIFLGFAALHANLRDLGPELLTVAALIVAVTAAKLAAAYGAARAIGLHGADAAVVAASLQCGGVMTIAVSLAVLDENLITTRMHAALTLSGLLTTVVVGPLLGRPGRPVRVQ